MMDTDNQAPLQHYLDWSNRGRPALWRYAIAIIIALAIWLIGPVPELLALKVLFDDTTFKALALTYSFIPGFLGLMLVTYLLLGRPGYSLFSAKWPANFADYGWGVLIGYAIGAFMLIATWPFLGITFQGWGPEKALGLPLIAALLIGYMFQTGFEELFFRGLVMQATRRITSWLPIVIGFQALLFAAPHFGNVGAWSGLGQIAILPYIIIALSWGWVCWRTGSVLMSMGLHFANNTFLAFAAGTTGDIVPPFAPLLQNMPSLPTAVLVIAVQAVLTIIAVEILVRRRNAAAARAAA